MAGLNLAKFLWQRTIALLRASAALLVAEELSTCRGFSSRQKRRRIDLRGGVAGSAYFRLFPALTSLPGSAVLPALLCTHLLKVVVLA